MAVDKVTFATTPCKAYACSANFRSGKGLKLEATLPEEIIITRRKGKTQINIPLDHISDFYCLLHMLDNDIARNVPGCAPTCEA